MIFYEVIKWRVGLSGRSYKGYEKISQCKINNLIDKKILLTGGFG